MIDRLSEVDAIVLVASEEEGFVLPDGTSQIESKLSQPDERLRSILGIRVPLICVEGFVAKEVESISVIVAAAAARSDRDRGAAIPALFGSGVVGRDFEFSRVVGSDAVKI